MLEVMALCTGHVQQHLILAFTRQIIIGLAENVMMSNIHVPFYCGVMNNNGIMKSNGANECSCRLQTKHITSVKWQL